MKKYSWRYYIEFRYPPHENVCSQLQFIPRIFLRDAITIFGSELIFFMQLHLPYLFWTPSNMHLQLSRLLEFIYFMQLQFWRFSELILISFGQVSMNGDTFPRKAPKECSMKFVAVFKGKFLTRGNVLRIFFLFLEDFGAPL